MTRDAGTKWIDGRHSAQTISRHKRPSWPRPPCSMLRWTAPSSTGNREGGRRTTEGMRRAGSGSTPVPVGKTLTYVRYLDDFPAFPFNNSGTTRFHRIRGSARCTSCRRTRKVIERCLLMATDPGDLVLDPTCGSGTTAYVAEQWGRRWITVDTSRVALSLARTRLMSARYPYYLLADSPEGQTKESDLTGEPPIASPRTTSGRASCTSACPT